MSEELKKQLGGFNNKKNHETADDLSKKLKDLIVSPDFITSVSEAVQKDLDQTSSKSPNAILANFDIESLYESGTPNYGVIQYAFFKKIFRHFEFFRNSQILLEIKLQIVIEHSQVLNDIIYEVLNKIYGFYGFSTQTWDEYCQSNNDNQNNTTTWEQFVKQSTNEQSESNESQKALKGYSLVHLHRAGAEVTETMLSALLGGAPAIITQTITHHLTGYWDRNTDEITQKLRLYNKEQYILKLLQDYLLTDINNQRKEDPLDFFGQYIIILTLRANEESLRYNQFSHILIRNLISQQYPTLKEFYDSLPPFHPDLLDSSLSSYHSSKQSEGQNKKEGTQNESLNTLNVVLVELHNSLDSPLETLDSNQSIEADIRTAIALWKNRLSINTILPYFNDVWRVGESHALSEKEIIELFKHVGKLNDDNVKTAITKMFEDVTYDPVLNGIINVIAILLLGGIGYQGWDFYQQTNNGQNMINPNVSQSSTHNPTSRFSPEVVPTTAEGMRESMIIMRKLQLDILQELFSDQLRLERHNSREAWYNVFIDGAFPISQVVDNEQTNNIEKYNRFLATYQQTIQDYHTYIHSEEYNQLSSEEKTMVQTLIQGLQEEYNYLSTIKTEVLAEEFNQLLQDFTFNADHSVQFNTTQLIQEKIQELKIEAENDRYSAFKNYVGLVLLFLGTVILVRLIFPKK